VSALLQVASGAQRLQIGLIVGSSEQNRLDVVDVVRSRAASLAGPPVTVQNLRSDLSPRPG
jgi:hypothetical protein